MTARPLAEIDSKLENGIMGFWIWKTCSQLFYSKPDLNYVVGVLGLGSKMIKVVREKEKDVFPASMTRVSSKHDWGFRRA
ncbi:hypothetical protein GBA52_012348 [Prunus armeniaca]|nr:hypothetical protein GBA52_012348 [Prunus armeniaca]